MLIKIKDLTGDNLNIKISFDLYDGTNIIKSWENVMLDREIMNTPDKIINWCKSQARAYSDHYQKMKNQEVLDIVNLQKQVLGSYAV